MKPRWTAYALGALITVVPAVIAEASAPRISGPMPQRLARKLEAAHRLALQRVEQLPECRSLFSRLGADGQTTLDLSIYYQATHNQERRVCSRGSVAFTYVGSPQIRLCNGFSRLNDTRAAQVLLHEALHYAGQTEEPSDPKGVAPADIDRMVSRRCGF